MFYTMDAAEDAGLDADRAFTRAKRKLHIGEVNLSVLSPLTAIEFAELERTHGQEQN